MKQIFLFLRLIDVTIDIRKFNNTNSRYHKKSKQIINQLIKGFDSKLFEKMPTNFKTKLQWYMAEFAYSSEKFNNLLSLKPTSSQTETYFLAGALVGMCDLIIDDIEMEENRIKLFKYPKNEEEYSDPIEKFYARCYHNFIKSIDFDIKERSIKYYQDLFDAQINSKRQFDKNLSKLDVDAICKDKCGYTTLFIRSLVKSDIDLKEEKAWYELGGYIQYCNDSQDLYKDLKKGLITFATVRKDLITIAEDLDKQKQIAFKLIKETSYSTKKKDNFLLPMYIMGLGIFAKLQKFLLLCNYDFSFNKLQSLEKSIVRSNTSVNRLIPYVLPKALKYDYNKIEKSYAFKTNFNNKPNLLINN